jgi:hypothetical protein
MKPSIERQLPGSSHRGSEPRQVQRRSSGAALAIAAV